MELDFNDEFRNAFNLIEHKGKNIFLTGKAGTGKSTFLNYLVSNSKKKIIVLAPTGVAAVNVSGQTIHSFFKLPPGVTLNEAKEEAINRKKIGLYKAAEVFVIDEISMVRADLLDAVDVFLRTALNSDKAFAGKQMVFIGDLHQLPPVVSNDEKLAFTEFYKSEYFFDSLSIKKLEYELIEFGKIYRQSDREFIELLNRIRNKTITDSDINKINSQKFSGENDNGFVHLTATNKMADEINLRKLNEIKAPEYRFKALIEGTVKLEHLPADGVLSLKKGAQIMFLVNDPLKRWVNGSIGTITEINGMNVKAKLLNEKIVSIEPHDWEIKKYRFNSVTKTIEKDLIGVFTQLPVRLAWAITIHKSQGKTFEKTIIDVGSGAFTHGQLYVALSRNTCLEGIKIKTPLRKSDVLLDGKVVEYMKKTEGEKEGKKLKEKSHAVSN